MDDGKKLMLETIETAVEYIGNLLDSMEKISSDIQIGREDKALSVCSELIDGFKWILDALTLTKPAQEEYGEIIDTSPLNELFGQMIEAFENKDYVLISDILGYEIKPVLEGWYLKLHIIVNSTRDGHE